MIPIPQIAIIWDCLLGLVVSSMNAWLSGEMNAPATP